jgi:Arc/MetJ family transcription regulator
MATNLSIDPELIEWALKVSGERTKKAAVTKALQKFIARRRQKRLLELMGKLEWDSSLTTRRSVGAIEPFRRHECLVTCAPARFAFSGDGSAGADPSH